MIMFLVFGVITLYPFTKRFLMIEMQSLHLRFAWWIGRSEDVVGECKHVQVQFK